MTVFETRRQLLELNLPGGAAINAEALIHDYGYPFDSAVHRAMAWWEESQRITALGGRGDDDPQLMARFAA